MIVHNRKTIEKASSMIELAATEKCPVCQAVSGRRVLFELDQFKVCQCQCRHRFIDPSLTDQSQITIYQSSDALKEINPACESYYEYDTFAPRSLTYRDYVKAICEVESLVQKKTLLEVGCGTGSFIRLARQRAWTVAGVDSSRQNIEASKKEGLDAECSGFLDYQSHSRYDCLVLWDIIEHLRSPEIFLGKCRELLVRNGFLLLATPHYPNLLTAVSEFLYRISLGTVSGPIKKLYMLEHTSYFSEGSLKSLLAQEGFSVVKSWKTETDLDRYRFVPILKIALKISFCFARLLHLQNRIHLIAQKK